VRRTVEAGALRLLVEQATLSGARPVVVMGDVNDSVGSRTHAILTGEPPLLPDEPMPASFRPEAALYPAVAFLDPRGPGGSQPTFVHAGRYDAFDHVFVSAHFHPHSRRRQWAFRGLRVLNDHLDERDGDEAQRSTSDHGAVAVTFVYAP
jgi:endonuclease/exonuclease/phosphatase family metal-dependent hydrolase